MTKEEIDDCLYQAGLTAQGCWDELDDYAKEGIYRLCKLVAQKEREWVGLTDKERDYFTYIDAKDKARFRKYFDYIEAKLKEKNGY